MAITHGAATRTAIADLVVDRIDAGAGAGTLEIRQSTTVLSTHALSDPAFGAAVGPTATAGAIADATVAAAGTPDNFQIKDSNGNVVLSGSAGDVGSGADLEVNIPGGGWLVGGTVTIGSGSYTAPL